MDEILKYFPDLTREQIEALEALGPVYTEWNDKINVISRKDIDNLYTRHILHSLAIAKFVKPEPGTEIGDVGTGGGFPGIPLAVLWPQCRFHLVDRIAKKLKVAQAAAEAARLTNVEFQHGDMGECHKKFVYVVSRAVMPLPDLVKITRKNIAEDALSNSLPPGLLCLKGGDLAEEIAGCRRPVLEVPLTDYFHEAYFETKKLLYVKL